MKCVIARIYGLRRNDNMEKEIICISNFSEDDEEKEMELIKVKTTGDYFKKEGEKLGKFIYHQASSAFVESLMKTICDEMGYFCNK